MAGERFIFDMSRIKAVKCMRHPTPDVQLNPVGWTPTLLLQPLPLTHDVLLSKELSKVFLFFLFFFLS